MGGGLRERRGGGGRKAKSAWNLTNERPAPEPPTTEEKDAEAPTLSQGIAGAARPITKPRERKNTPAARQAEERFARGFQASMWGVEGALHGANAAAAIIAKPAAAPTTTEAAVPEVALFFASGTSSTPSARVTEEPPDEEPPEVEPQVESP